MKHMAFFWTGPMSWFRFTTLKSFRLLHPDWTITLYTCDYEPKSSVSQEGKLQDFVHYIGRDYWPEVKYLEIDIKNMVFPFKMEPAQQCDYTQWWHLYNYGGFFADMDILFIRPIDFLEALGSKCEIIYCYHKWFSIGVMGGQPQSQFYKDLVDYCTVSIDENDEYQSCGSRAIIATMTGSTKLDRGLEAFNTLVRKYPKSLNLRFREFYPWDYNALDNLFERDEELYPDTLGIHWYGGRPMSQEYNKLEHPYEQKCTITTWCKKLGLQGPDGSY